MEQLARIRLAEIEASKSTEQERTKQIALLTAVIRGEQATTRQALDLVRWAQSSPNRALGRLELPKDELTSVASELLSESEREKEFADQASALERIDEEDLNRLTSRLRPMISEIGLPLKRGAKTINITNGTGRKHYAYINESIVQDIRHRSTSDRIDTIVGRVKSYDRDSGVGKFTSDEFVRIINFLVPLKDRNSLRDKILEAMRRQNITIKCRKVLDDSGMPTSLILIDVDLGRRD